MSSNPIVFHTSSGISSLTTFLFLIFPSTESSSFCLNCLMFSWLLIFFVIGSCVTFEGFLRIFWKFCFHRCICSSWLVAISLAFAALFFHSTSVIVCHAILDCLSSTESLILLIWFCMHFVCSFRYALVNSFWASLRIWALILVGFHQLHREAVFTSARLFLTNNVSQGTRGLGLCLVGMHSAAASKWASTKFSYSSSG